MKEYYFLKQQSDKYQEEEDHAKSVIKSINSAQQKLLTCIDELAFFTNHPNLMPRENIKRPEEKWYILDMTETKGVAKMSFKNVMDMAARLKMTMPH